MAILNNKDKDLIAKWRNDILYFCEHGLRFSPMKHQEKVLLCVQKEQRLPIRKRKKRIACKSGQGAGKTAVMCAIGMWRSIQYVDSLGVVTANNMRQCKQWIDEANRLVNGGHPLLRKIFKFYTTSIRVAKRRLWKITTATATRPENIQGIHEEHLTIMIDETSGIPESIITTIKGTLSNPDSLVVACGNPNSVDCEFHNFFTTDSDAWHLFTFNTEEIARDYPHIVDPKRNEDFAKEYGKDSDIYRVRVLGEFPRQSAQAVLSLEDVIACTKTSRSGCARISTIHEVHRAIAIDFARGGSDESVMVLRHGLSVMGMETYIHWEPRAVVDEAFAAQVDRGWSNEDTFYVPDAGGMGQGVVYSFYEAGKNVVEFHNNGNAHDKTMFANLESEAWWYFRSLVRHQIVHLPNDKRLHRQLVGRQYYLDRKGRIKVESKKEVQQRTKSDESPDRAQAVVMAFYPHAAPASVASAERASKLVGTSLRDR